ncbi:MAG: YraN family protein [Candidatus Omnitrophica bacterium]|nr:YraN family protein [Candidatus Omnitrophota bacterium]
MINLGWLLCVASPPLKERCYAMKRIMLGKRGEKLACQLLKRAGYVILKRNFRHRIGEIDIIAKDAAEIVIVEVRSTRGLGFCDPLESITFFKIRRLQKLASIWFLTTGNKLNKVRFDVITVVFYEGRPKITHIKNAF